MKDPDENKPGYDPARHHRRSIRLKSHDYTGGGVYFVTICAHRDAGDVVGAFKSLIVHEYIAGVKAGRCAPFRGKIWHRNYYETIVRTPEAETRIAEYIRMNPWKLVQHATHEGQSFRMIGNPALLNREKIGVLCSRNCPPEALRKAEAHAWRADARHCFIGGFHSPPEQALLAGMGKAVGSRLAEGGVNALLFMRLGAAMVRHLRPIWPPHNLK